MKLTCAAVLLCATAHAQWTIQDSRTTADLRGIHSLGNGVAWASGTEGTVLRTTNDGKDWQRCTTPPDGDHLDFRGIQAFDASTAIVMSSGKGPLSRLYKTTDACRTWTLLFTNPDPEGFWDAVRIDETGTDKGLLVFGDPVESHFVLWVSHNGESDWRKWPTSSTKPGESAFAASNSAIADESWDGVRIFGTGGPEGARVFIQCDPCTSKEFETDLVQTMDMFPKGSSAGIFSITEDFPQSGMHLVAVGGDYSKPNVRGSAAFTTDRFHWKATETPPHGYRSSVAYDPTTRTWITVGPNGTDASTDDGRNWRPLRPGPTDAPDADQHWNALSLPFVVGPHGRIGKLRSDAIPEHP
jgi:photosystem II stability/assembly factor-like uncharacterized protein